MKKLLFFAACAVLVLASCGDGKSKKESEMRADSLQQALVQKDSEINDMMAIFNDIEEGFREINEAEKRLDIARSGEGADKRQQIKDNIVFIQKTMLENKERIAKLNKQLRSSNVKGEEMKRSIENLTKQLEEKEQQLQQLRAELDAKDIHISELDETINELNSNVNRLADEGEKKSEKISSQDKQLNTAWYVYGTKKELKEEKILVDGKFLQSNFNREYFTKIDIRVLKEISLHSKSAKLLTTHAADSYKLEKDSKGQYVLRITKPETFWSTSKYLVIQVK